MADYHVAVIGSAHLDIISDVTEDPETIDKIGDIRYEFGGTAYNYATNLQLMGLQVTFIGALNNSPISHMITGELGRNGINTHIQVEPEMPESGFCAHIIDGELYSAVSSMPVEKVAFSDGYLLQGLAGVDVVMADCNLSTDVLNQIVRLSHELDLPCFIAGVSEAKCRKLTEIDLPYTAALINENEANQLVEVLDLRAKGWAGMARHLNQLVVATEGGKQVSICHEDGTMDEVEVPAVKVEKNVLGAGDLFGSCTIKSFLKGNDIKTAVEHAVIRTASILSKENANLGRTGALSENIQMITSEAEQDKLTGILNRHGLEKQIKKHNLAAKSCYLLICDIDHFKSINDRYGHDQGDVVLKQVAETLKTCVRRGDILGRWGGEEFLCVVVSPEPMIAKNLGERIRASVAALKMPEIESAITVSIGLASHHPHENWEKVFKRADTALYQAKNNGRNQVVSDI